MLPQYSCTRLPVPDESSTPCTRREQHCGHQPSTDTKGKESNTPVTAKAAAARRVAAAKGKDCKNNASLEKIQPACVQGGAPCTGRIMRDDDDSGDGVSHGYSLLVLAGPCTSGGLRSTRARGAAVNVSMEAVERPICGVAILYI